MTSYVVNLGDCLDPVSGLASLPDKSVDHVLTDPPYSERVHRLLGTEGRNDGAGSRDALSFCALTDEVRAGVVREACRVARRWVLVFSCDVGFGGWIDALNASGGQYVRKGVWVKADQMPQMSGDRPAPGTEEIIIGHAPRPPKSGRMRWNGGGKPAVYTGNTQERGVERQHPTQKPLWLLEALVRDFTDAGETILDPFAGSGTTGVACKRLGRSFIGWERDPKYHRIAEKRIAAAREQLGLWTGAA